jgi:hypothetical protein
MMEKRGKSYSCQVILLGVAFLVCFGVTNAWADKPIESTINSNAIAATPSTGCVAEYLLGVEDPRLDTLRGFRDDVLAKSTVGNKLIGLYYSNSDAAIVLLDKNPQIKESATAVLESLSVNISSNASAQSPDEGGICPAENLLGEKDPRLDTLRGFRDNVLAKSAFGSKLIALYYNTGEAVIAALNKNPTIKKAATKTLKFLVRK